MKMKPPMKALFAALGLLIAGQAFGAEHRSEMVRELGIALAQGNCTVVMQKQYQTTGTTTTGSYIADNHKLHQCQYVQEMVDSGCVEKKTCQSYTQWSKGNPAINPRLPRAAFVANLDARRNVLFASHNASSNRPRKRS